MVQRDRLSKPACGRFSIRLEIALHGLTDELTRDAQAGGYSVEHRFFGPADMSFCPGDQTKIPNDLHGLWYARLLSDRADPVIQVGFQFCQIQILFERMVAEEFLEYGNLLFGYLAVRIGNHKSGGEQQATHVLRCFRPPIQIARLHQAHHPHHRRFKVCLGHGAAGQL